MKREFVEDKVEDHTNMFSKLHHPSHDNKFQHLYPPPSQEADSPDRRRPNDGATIEVVRRPRGRPPGSKNKPKPPVVISGDSSAEPAMSPYVLELPEGVDIIESTARFCRKRNMGLCFLNGNGAVTNVTLKQPSTPNGSTVTFHGRFDILSISATILPAGGGDGPFAVSVAGPQGQVVGGHVVGPLVSAGTIYLVAANFSNPSFHRLHQNMDDEKEESCAVESPKSGGGLLPTSGGAAVYSYQSADVIWAPAARQQQPY